MRRSIRWYVTSVTMVAATWLFVLYRTTPPLDRSLFNDAGLLCGLAVVAELLAYVLPQSAAGSLGFIPYFAAAIVVPSWPSVVCVIIVKGALELIARRAPIKA